MFLNTKQIVSVITERMNKPTVIPTINFTWLGVPMWDKKHQLFQLRYEKNHPNWALLTTKISEVYLPECTAVAIL